MLQCDRVGVGCLCHVTILTGLQRLTRQVRQISFAPCFFGNLVALQGGLHVWRSLDTSFGRPGSFWRILESRIRAQIRDQKMAPRLITPTVGVTSRGAVFWSRIWAWILGSVPPVSTAPVVCSAHPENAARGYSELHAELPWSQSLSAGGFLRRCMQDSSAVRR